MTWSYHRTDGLAEAGQRQHEKDAADRYQGEKLRPDDAETGPAVKNGLGERHEMRGRRGQHDVLHEPGHTLARGVSAG